MWKKRKMTEHERRFRLAMTIQDNAEMEGAHAILALTEEEGKATPVLAIQAGGFTPDAAGALLLANMLSDASQAIMDNLTEGSVGVHVVDVPDTASLPVVKRPRFNPRPVGGN